MTWRSPVSKRIWWRHRSWTIKDAVAEAGIKRRTFEYRRAKGWTVAAALETPINTACLPSAHQLVAEEIERRRQDRRLRPHYKLPTRAEVLQLTVNVAKLQRLADRLLARVEAALDGRPLARIGETEAHDPPSTTAER